jgi:hypothetical protein
MEIIIFPSNLLRFFIVGALQDFWARGIFWFDFL